jgi:uncharacterized sporulation protein YeaH/YhbH (DUF444 family)
VSLRIETDQTRFREIVRGRIRGDLRRFMSQGELIGRQGGTIVSIPLPQIETPHFTFSPKQVTGVGAGPGAPGTPLGPGGDGETAGGAGNEPGEHLLEVEVSLEELAEILGEELQLPRIRPKGDRSLTSPRERYTGISRVGPESLRHFKRSYRAALRRQIASGMYDPDSPRVFPIREDRRYRVSKPNPRPETAAVILYMMDVSGSMGDEQKEIVRIEAFWIDTWLKAHYPGLERRFIVHDAEARQVDEDTFYRTRESGGTVISSAYRLAHKIVQEEFPPDGWNVYLFHFSDGDNWSQGDTEECLGILKTHLLPAANLFGYGQVESPYGTGQFLHDIESAFEGDERVVFSAIEGKEAILDSIRSLLGRGR